MTRNAAIAAIQAHLGIPVKILSPAKFFAAWPTADWTAFFCADGSPADETHPKMAEGDFAQACEAGMETSHGPAGEAVGWFDRERGLFVVCYEDAHPEAAILRNCLKHAKEHPDRTLRTRALVLAGRLYADWFLSGCGLDQPTIIDHGHSVSVWGAIDEAELKANAPGLLHVFKGDASYGCDLKFDKGGRCWRFLMPKRRAALEAAAKRLKHRILDGEVLKAEKEKALAGILAYVRKGVEGKRIPPYAEMKRTMDRLAVPVLFGEKRERARLAVMRGNAANRYMGKISQNRVWTDALEREVKDIARPLLEFDAHFAFALF